MGVGPGAAAATAQLPAGLVTFVFTDIEGSTDLLVQLESDYRAVLERHREIVRDATRAHRGHVVSTDGDATFLAFDDAANAVRAMRAIHAALAAEPWPRGVHVRVRAGAHSDEAIPRGEDYVALGVHQAARVAAAAHGGQLLVSSTTAALARGRLPEDAGLRDLGSFVVRDFTSPERLHQLVAPELAAAFPPPRTATVARHNLPVERSSFVGRVAELSDVNAALRTSRLVTLAGPGGVGKTRVASEIGARLAERHADGVWLAALAPARDLASVVAAVAGAVNVPIRDADDPVAELVAGLSGRDLVLILDNCEHVLEAAGIVAEQLLSGTDVRVLATSREPLGVYGEHLLRLPPLAVENAVRLFRDRAAAGVATDDDEDVDAVVRHLDGLPLAVELAAACSRTIGVRELAARLDDRFRLLQSRSPGAMPHHRTLLGLVEWSHDLLTDKERVLFRRLAVFSGGCTLDAAERTCAGDLLPVEDVITTLSGLVDKSLVQIGPGVTGAMRYTMLETLRLYGLEQLRAAGEEPEAQRRHQLAMAELAGAIRVGIVGPDFADWLRRADEESVNLVAALTWPLDDDDARATRLAIVAGCADYWVVRGALRAVPWWSAVIAESSDLDRETRLLAEVGLAGLLTNEDEPARVRTMLEEILERDRGQAPSGAIARATGMLAWAYANEDRLDDARTTAAAAVAKAEETGEPYAIAVCYLFASSVHANTGDPELALAEALAGIEVATRAGITRVTINAEIDLGWAHLVAADPDAAEGPTRRALEMSIAARSPAHETSARLNLGHVMRLRGDAAGAAGQYYEAFVAARACGIKRDAAEALEGLAMLGAPTTEPRRAATLVGAAERLRTSAYPMESALKPAVDAAVEALRGELGDEMFAAMRTRGAGLADHDVDMIVLLARDATQ